MVVQLNITFNNLKVISYSLCTLSVIPTVHAKRLTTQDRPNIVVIVADDLLSSDLSCYGGKNLITPNIDLLAKEGVRFINNYASAAMSVPIRASMYTGLYPARHGSYQNHKNTYPSVKSITEYMPATGYRLGRTGKQHSAPKKVYNFEEIPGFTVDCVSPNANFTTDGIREFINRDKNPFCLFVCSINPHMPWTWGNPKEFDPQKLVLPPIYPDNVGLRNLYCKYLAEVRSLDNEVGAVIDVLKQSNKLDNTLIIFLGEQGSQIPGAKWTCWNAGVSSALIVSYPKLIKAGTIASAIVQYEDILPTLIDIAGGKKIQGIDGQSFLPVLYGKRKDHRKWAYGIHNNIPEGTPYPIRSIRDKRYKLILNLTPEKEYYEKHLMSKSKNNTIWVEWLKAVEADTKAAWLNNSFIKRPAIEFYDMHEDPWELNNIADQPQYSKRIANMEKELRKWMVQQGDKGADMDVEFKN